MRAFQRRGELGAQGFCRRARRGRKLAVIAEVVAARREQELIVIQHRHVIWKSDRRVHARTGQHRLSLRRVLLFRMNRKRHRSEPDENERNSIQSQNASPDAIQTDYGSLRELRHARSSELNDWRKRASGSRSRNKNCRSTRREKGLVFLATMTIRGTRRGDRGTKKMASSRGVRRAGPGTGEGNDA